MNLDKMKKCDYPECPNEIRKTDEQLKPETAKLCEQHHAEMNKYLDDNDVRKLTVFMMKVAFK